MLLRPFQLQFRPAVRPFDKPTCTEPGAEAHLQAGNMVGPDTERQPAEYGKLPGEQFGTETFASIKRVEDHQADAPPVIGDTGKPGDPGTVFCSERSKEKGGAREKQIPGR